MARLADRRRAVVAAKGITAWIERVGVERREAQGRVRREQLTKARDPCVGARRRPRQRDRGQRGGDSREVLHIVGEAVRRRPAEPLLSGARDVPGDTGVQLGLVPDLERLDVPAADSREQVVRFGCRDRGAVGLEVDPEDQTRVRRLGELPGVREPCRRQRVVDPARAPNAGNWPPGLIAALAPDADDRRVSGRQIPDQPREHRVGAAATGELSAGNGPILERDADERSRDCVAEWLRRDRHDVRVG